MTTGAPKKTHDGRVIGLVGGAHFFSHFYIFVLPPLFPVLKAELGLSYAALGGIITAFSIASGSAQYPMGVAVDRFGARHILVGGLAVLAGSIALMSLSDGYWSLIALAFLAGLGNGVFHPADYSILGASVSERRLGRAYSIHTFSGHVGWSLAPPLVVFLTALWNWRVALALVGAAGLVMAVVLAFQGRWLNSDHKSPETADAVDAGKTAASLTPAPRGTLQMLLATPILMMFVFYLATSALTAGMASFTPSALTALFETPLVAANAALTALLVGGAVGVLCGGVIADRLRRLDLISAIGFTAASAAMCVIAFVDLPLIGLVAAFGFAGFMIGMVSPSRDLMVRAVTPAGASGKVFGFVSIGLDVGGACAPPLFGWLIDQGAPAGVFLGAAMMMMFALLAALGAARYRPGAAQASPAE